MSAVLHITPARRGYIRRISHESPQDQGYVFHSFPFPFVGRQAGMAVHAMGASAAGCFFFFFLYVFSVPFCTRIGWGVQDVRAAATKRDGFRGGRGGGN